MSAQPNPSDPTLAASARSDNVAAGPTTISEQEIGTALKASAARFAEASGARPPSSTSDPARGELMASFLSGPKGSTEAEDDIDFAALIADIKNNPEKVLKTDFTPEQILELQKRINPYAFVPGPKKVGNEPELVRSVAASYTNLREDYIRRFTATSFIGFIFQILDEWTVPPEVRRWVPHPRKKKGEKAAAVDAASAPYDPAVLVGQLEGALVVAKEALKAKQENDAAIQKTKEEMAVDDKSDAAAKAKAVSDGMAARAAGLLWGATHTACRIGLEAEKRLDATTEDAAKYPEVQSILSRSSVRANAGSQIEMPADTAKGIITNFLKHWLQFDPNVHVKAARDGKADAGKAEIETELGKVLTDKDDPARLPLEVVLAKAPKPTEEDSEFLDIIKSSRGNYNTAMRALRDRELAATLIYALMSDENADRFRRYLYPIPAKTDPFDRDQARKAIEIIPPQDTFHRWGYYTEVNYEELRTATEVLYNEKPDLDWAIGIWEMWEGTEDEVKEKFRKYCERYEEEVPSSIKKLDFGSWCLVGDFKKNRENIKFYNKHTDVLKRIMDRHTEDKKLGADLMRKRVKDLKSKNIADAGPDAPGLGQYKKTATALPSLGAEQVISAVEMRRLEKARGDPKAARELEVLEENEKKIIEFGKIAANRPLSQVEEAELRDAKRALERAIESINVPEGALQVDTFTHDAKTGEFTKSHFYTKAEKPEHMEQIRREMAQQAGSSTHPIARRQAAANAAGRLPGILEEVSNKAAGGAIEEKEMAAPASTSYASRQVSSAQTSTAAEAPIDDVKLENLAPFAIQYMKLQEERTNADRKREALADASEAKAGSAQNHETQSAPTDRQVEVANTKESGAKPGTMDIQLPGTNITIPIPAGSVAVVVESIPDSDAPAMQGSSAAAQGDHSANAADATSATVGAPQ